MTNLQEIARLVREELLTLIRPVQLLSVNPSKDTGDVSGRFRSNGVLFDYTIGGGTVRYRPVGAGGGGDRSDAADQDVWAGPRLDPDQGGDPRMPERLKKMRDSMLALMPDSRKAGGRRKDSAEPDLAELLKELTLSRLALRNRWSAARRDAYREVLERSA